VRLREQITEDEMIVTFVRGELDSGRYGERLCGMLARDARTVDDLGDADYARRLLEEYRAYERREGLFLGFPRDVEWFRAELSRDELLDVLYINWDWWLRLSGGTRRPRVAAARIRAGEIPGVTAEQHEVYARQPQPELIVATTPTQSPLVVLEGHVRLTAYALFPERVPDPLGILLGVSAEMPGWSNF
jgi:hypothetical protein